MHSSYHTSHPEMYTTKFKQSFRIKSFLVVNKNLLSVFKFERIVYIVMCDRVKIIYDVMCVFHLLVFIYQMLSSKVAHR